ncbi:MAG: nuclear transport factor 2 family protein [Acidimicrobiaceae bacterium]|nr:nuclear transport factor 2 family protein [Acidimicrobiaceae bacterium]
MANGDSRLQALEDRIQALEDQLAVYRVISSYGPAVDTGSSQKAAALWTEDGVYEFDSYRLDGAGAVAGMVEGDTHQSLIRHGCAHVLAMPVVRVEGDRAFATGYSRVYRHVDDRYEVWRVSANDWELARTPAGWRVTRRTNHQLDGSEVARQLLRSALDDSPTDR